MLANYVIDVKEVNRVNAKNWGEGEMIGVKVIGSTEVLVEEKEDDNVYRKVEVTLFFPDDVAQPLVGEQLRVQVFNETLVSLSQANTEQWEPSHQ